MILEVMLPLANPTSPHQQIIEISLYGFSSPW